jgi:hypothetical protein
MRVSPILAAFNAGELSPQLRGRIDLDKYAMGCETLENFFCRAHGGVQRRPGTYFLNEVKSSSKSTRLIPFQFNTTQAYILEFGDKYIRFIKDFEQLTVSGAVYEISSPYAEADLSKLQYAQDADIMYICHPDYPVYKLSRTAHTAWTIEAVTFTDGPYQDQNTTDTTLAAGATTGTGVALVASQNLFDSGHVGCFFRIYAGSSWGYVKITYVTDAKNAVCDVISAIGGMSAVKTWCEGAWSIKNGYPTAVVFLEQRVVFAASPSFPQTICASVIGNYEDFTPGTNDDDPFTYTIASQEMNAIRWMVNLANLFLGTTTGEARLGQYGQVDPVSPNNAKVTFQSFYGSAASPGMAVGLAILFWERRGHPDNYGERLREFSYVLSKDQYAGVDLTIMAEHISKGGITGMVRQQYPYNILWCVRADGMLIGMTYERDQDVVGWHRHPVGGDGIVEEIACIPGPNQDDIYLVVNRVIGGAVKRYIEVLGDVDWGDDQADCFFVDCGLTYDGTEKTISGITHTVPYPVTAFDTLGITATSHGFSNGDHVKISDVEGMTEVNGMELVVANKTTHYFEAYVPHGMTFSTYTSGGIAKKMTNAPAGLGHLEGEEVDVLTDGAVHPPCTVTSGSIALGWYAAKVQAGLHYDSILTTMGLEGGSREGTSQGKQKRVHEVALRLYQTLGGKFGPDEDTLETLGFRTARDTYGNPPALFTGDKDKSFPGDWDSEAKVTVVQDQPLPMTLLSILPRFRSEDR